MVIQLLMDRQENEKTVNELERKRGVEREEGVFCCSSNPRWSGLSLLKLRTPYEISREEESSDQKSSLLPAQETPSLALSHQHFWTMCIYVL